MVVLVVVVGWGGGCLAECPICIWFATGAPLKAHTSVKAVQTCRSRVLFYFLSLFDRKWVSLSLQRIGDRCIYAWHITIEYVLDIADGLVSSE